MTVSPWLAVPEMLAQLEQHPTVFGSPYGVWLRDQAGAQLRDMLDRLDLQITDPEVLRAGLVFAQLAIGRLRGTIHFELALRALQTLVWAAADYLPEEARHG